LGVLPNLNDQNKQLSFPGTAVISVALGEKIVECNVTVTEPDYTISITPGSLLMVIGETQQLQVELVPMMEDKLIVWTTEDPEIADVDQSGNVTAVSPGTTKIVANTAEKSVECEVIVTEPEATELGKQKVAEVPMYGMGGSRLTFSPDGKRFVYFVEGALNEEASLVDLQGTESCLSSNCGPVSWRGTRVVYFERLDWEEPPIITIVVYDIQRNTYTRINHDMLASMEHEYNTSIKPVLSGESTVSVIMPDGLWKYDLNQRIWTHALAFEAEDNSGWTSGVGPWPTVTWSPDFGKVAWLETVGLDTRLVLLDITSGNKNTIDHLHPISLIAWSGDSTKLAAAGGGELSILSLEGNVIDSFPGPDYSQGRHQNITLSWVPGQDNKVAYNSEEGLAIRDVVNGDKWVVYNIRDYTWLQNGNLANLGDVDDLDWVLEIFEIDWR